MNDELAEISVKRRMPASLTRFLIKVQGGKVYLPAAYRLVWFRDECPDWGIVTELIEGGQQDGLATMKATIFNPEGRIVATGHKTETKQDFPAGWVEKAEAGAIARALAYVGFGTQFSEDVDEPKQPERINTPAAPQNALQRPTEAKNGNYAPPFDGAPDYHPAPDHEEKKANHRGRFFALWHKDGLPDDHDYQRFVVQEILKTYRDDIPATWHLRTMTKLTDEGWELSADHLEQYMTDIGKQGWKPTEEPEFHRSEVTA